MPGKPDPTQIVTLVLKTTGGVVAGASALAPRLGPLGLSAKKVCFFCGFWLWFLEFLLSLMCVFCVCVQVGEDIAKNTKSYLGLPVTVKLTIQNRQAQIEVVPTAALLVLKELNEPPRAKGEKFIKHDGNLTLEQIYSIARTMREQGKSRSRTFGGSCKEILGTANSVGCTVEGVSPREIQRQITEGELDVPEE
ncbi:MAG: hypothetical protein MHM6MM_007661 [Cercozoa sp. M6MM]